MTSRLSKCHQLRCCKRASLARYAMSLDCRPRSRSKSRQRPAARASRWACKSRAASRWRQLTNKSIARMKRIPPLRIRCLIVATITLLLTCVGSRAQEKEPDEVIKVNTDLVVFDAQVIDKKSKRIIADLTRDDFDVSDNGVKQQISYFSRDELPLSIILLLDVSRSVRPIIHDIRDGALNALKHL